MRPTPPAASAPPRRGEAIGSIRMHVDGCAFDALTIAAQGGQESGLDQSAPGRAGSAGIMRAPLSTTRDASVGFPDRHVADLQVKAEVKRLRLHRDRTLANPAIMRRDQTLIVFAACYAGRGDLATAGRRTERMGRDASARFGAVRLAMVKAVEREPVVCVRDILKCCVTCRLAEDRRLAGR